MTAVPILWKLDMCLLSSIYRAMVLLVFHHSAPAGSASVSAGWSEGALEQSVLLEGPRDPFSRLLPLLQGPMGSFSHLSLLEGPRCRSSHLLSLLEDLRGLFSHPPLLEAPGSSSNHQCAHQHHQILHLWLPQRCLQRHRLLHCLRLPWRRLVLPGLVPPGLVLQLPRRHRIHVLLD